MPNKSESIAKKIAQKLQEKNGYTFDPLTVIMIAGFILNVIRLVYECRNSKEDRINMLRNPTILEKIILRRETAKVCKGTDIKPKDMYRELVGWKLSNTEIEKLFEEAQNND